MGSAHTVSASSDVSIIRHMVSRVRERGVGIAGAGAQSPFSISEQLLAQEEIPAELDADRHLFRVELISVNKHQDTRNICFLYKPGTDRYTDPMGPCSS